MESAEVKDLPVESQGMEKESSFNSSSIKKDVVVSAKNLTKRYGKVEAIRNVDLEICSGEILAIVGPSGSGKSSLLHLIGLMDFPTEGQIYLWKKEAWRLPESERARLRNREIGFVFQFHHLLPEFNLIENVALPGMIAGMSKRDACQKAEGLLCELGLEHRKYHAPQQASGGEQQRAAVARALVMEPKLVLADEPTGNLDSETGSQVFDILCRSVRRRHSSLILATHNHDLALRADRIIKLIDGRIQSEA